MKAINTVNTGYGYEYLTVAGGQVGMQDCRKIGRYEGIQAVCTPSCSWYTLVNFGCDNILEMINEHVV